MEMDAAKLIGAGLAVIALAGVGVGIGNIFASLVTAVGRNPAAKNEVFGIAILWTLFHLWYASPFPFWFNFGMFKGLPARAIHLLSLIHI